MTRASSALIELRGIAKRYPGQVALDDVSLTIGRGEVHALVGENGAGKSTLIRVIAGATQPDEGTILVDGEVHRILGPRVARDLGIAVVHQEPQIAINRSVAENVFLGALPSVAGGVFFDRSAAKRQARRVLEPFGMDIDPHRTMSDYGTAARRVIEIAHAVSQNARLLILDEPTAALPAAERSVLLGLARDFADGGGSVLYVSHHLDEILEIADTVTALRNGRHAGTRPRSQVDRAIAIEMILGASLDPYVRDSSAVRSEVVLDVRDLKVTRDGASNDIQLRRGEVLGMFGRIDAGHEEVARIVGGVTRPVGGTMRLGGQRFRPRSPHAAKRRGVSFLPGERKKQAIFANSSVTENILAGNGIGAFAGLVRRGRRHSAAELWRERLGIKVPDVRQSISTLSGGNQQKCLMARLLASEPTVLVLEHPTVGVDLGARAEIYQTIARATEEGLAVLAVSDDLDELKALCDRVLVFRNGAITGALVEDEISSSTILGLAL
ncbi:MAG: sugar ABC transporter ATP-binding protein [Acidimicrobiales bacterium]